ncbi:MAG: adenylate/guanylate cyclase domain-containing protein [Chloroflexota bacterium]|nr:adenylate/guanylate cyclase domain-containing protein [Chloroflexota bacterium]
MPETTSPARWSARMGRIVLLSGIVLLVAFLAARSGLIEILELATYDLRFQLRGPRAPKTPIVIVAIDDESFEQLQQNVRSWPRADYARLISAIAAGNPAVIGVDIVFDTPGRDPGGDEALAEALRRAGNAVLSSHLSVQRGPGYTDATYSPPVPILAQAAAATGLANVQLDRDATARRVLIQRHFLEEWRPALSFEIARLYRGLPDEEFQYRRGQVTLGSQVYPVGADVSLLINFRGPPAETFSQFSMYQVLNGEVPADTFTDKIVLVGYTTLLEHDVYPTPFHRTHSGEILATPGVEIQANAVATLLDGNPIRRPPATVSWLLIGLGILTAILAFWRLKPLPALLTIVALVAVYLALALLAFSMNDLWLPVIPPVGMVALVTAAGLVERVVIEEREKRRLRDRFQHFMSPDRLRAVLDHWEDLLAEDRPEIEASVLFSDIRGFTSATEQLTRTGRSAEVISFLNRYADAMVEAVFAEQGVLDKVLGDGLLVLFGAPEPSPDHALLAVRTALRMADLLPELNAIWPLRDQRPLRIGIGIHSGPLVDGIVGRGRRVEYTVIGDAVNTASRVQDYTKDVLARRIAQEGDAGQPGATILITQSTYEQVKDRVQVDPDIPPYQAKGKAEPIRVYRVLGLSDLVDPKSF